MPRYYLPDPEDIDEDYLENICHDLQLALENMNDNDDTEYKQEFYDEAQEILRFIDALADTMMPDDDA
jgi:hypothetical protein